jgi:hypothetical protein
MSAFTASLPRAVSLCALAVVAVAGPLGAHAQSARHYHHRAAMTPETVDQRITRLHAALMITPDEETDWSGVADVIRGNDAAMRKMVAVRNAEPASDINAIDDLKNYERFNRAHLDGLKDLIVSFQTLYTAMPVSQQHVADRVLVKFRRKGLPTNS